MKGSSWYDVFGDADGNPKIAVTGAAHLQEDFCGLGSPLAGAGVRRPPARHQPAECRARRRSLHHLLRASSTTSRSQRAAACTAPVPLGGRARPARLPGHRLGVVREAGQVHQERHGLCGRVVCAPRGERVNYVKKHLSLGAAYRHSLIATVEASLRADWKSGAKAGGRVSPTPPWDVIDHVRCLDPAPLLRVMSGLRTADSFLRRRRDELHSPGCRGWKPGPSTTCRCRAARQVVAPGAAVVHVERADRHARRRPDQHLDRRQPVWSLIAIVSGSARHVLHGVPLGPGPAVGPAADDPVPPRSSATSARCWSGCSPTCSTPASTSSTRSWPATR